MDSWSPQSNFFSVQNSEEETTDPRRLIVDAAAQVFQKNGYASSSLQEVATICNMKVGSLFYRFSSKEDLLAEVIRTGLDAISYAVRCALKSVPSNSSVEVLLTAAITAHIRSALAMPNHVYVSNHVHLMGEIPSSIREAHDRNIRLYEQYWIDLLVDKLPVERHSAALNPQLAVAFILGAVNSILERADKFSVPVDALARDLVGILTRGLQPSHTSMRQPDMA